ncbi:hypothetical protein QR680_012868 [Steinernema hermaphroditum]|uniref:Uncharacterized protein n=1 Tax=Steinernema hermaphroditum TaxID=289476 RepID=A0AA39I6D9_9BILA|nr:hypothetical protein QR680_012868 [Steinernema hermaphroditum]
MAWRRSAVRIGGRCACDCSPAGSAKVPDFLCGGISNFFLPTINHLGRYPVFAPPQPTPLAISRSAPEGG